MRATLRDPRHPVNSDFDEDEAVTGTRPSLLFVHGVYHGAWCFEARWAPWFRARGHAVRCLDLPLDAERFSLDGCVRAIVEAWRERPSTLIGHSLGGRLVRAASARAPIEHVITVSTPSNAQLVRTALAWMPRQPLRTLAAIASGRHELLYHHARFADAMFFSGTLTPEERDAHLARVRAITYPRHALASVLGLAEGSPLHASSRLDHVVGTRDPSCRDTRARPGETLHVIEGGPHDLMLGPTWERAASVIASILDTASGVSSRQRDGGQG